MTAPEKLLPSNPDAERAVLGSILMDPDALTEAMRRLSPDDFFFPEHRLVFDAACTLASLGSVADLVTVGDELTRTGQLEEVGGYSGLSALSNQVPSSANVSHYAAIVARCASNRRLLDMCGKIAGVAAGDVDAANAIAEAEAALAWVRESYKPDLKESRLRPLSLSDLRQRPKPERFIDGLLLASNTSLMYGAPGCGKSTLVAEAVCCVALGRPFMGRKVKGGKVVWIAAEGGIGIIGRIDAWIQTHGVSDIPNLYVIPAAAQLLDAQDRAELTRSLSELGRDGDPLVWVVVDTVSQTSIGGDENSNSDMARYVDALAAIRDATGAHVSCVHHSGKDNEKGYRGASSLLGNVDTAWEITRAGDQSTVYCKKPPRDGWGPFAPFSFTADRIMPDGYNGLTFGVLRSLQASATSQASATGLGSTLDDGAWDALHALYGALDGLGYREWERAAGVKLQRRKPALMGLGFIQKTPDDNYHTTMSGIRALRASGRYQMLPGSGSVALGSAATAATGVLRPGSTVAPGAEEGAPA